VVLSGERGSSEQPVGYARLLQANSWDGAGNRTQREGPMRSTDQSANDCHASICRSVSSPMAGSVTSMRLRA
jgi:hypothetical protein